MFLVSLRTTLTWGEEPLSATALFLNMHAAALHNSPILSQHLLTSPVGFAALPKGTLSGKPPTVSPGFLAQSLQESTLAGQPSVDSSPQHGAQVSLSPSTAPEQGDEGEDPKLHPFNNPSLPPIPTRLLRVI